MSENIRAGSARATITPPLGIRLQGSITRDQPAHRVMDDLYAKLLLIEIDAERPALFTCDVIEFSRSFVSRVRERLRSEFGFKDENVMLCPSHTHTGPATIDLQDVTPDPDYLVQVEKQLAGLVRAAERKMVEVTVSVGRRRAEGVGINRRLATPRGIRQLPNPEGITDPEVKVVRFDDSNGDPVAFLVNYATHPTTLGVHVYEISADFPGRMQRIVEDTYGNRSMVHFVQGACGDVKAAAIGEDGNFKEAEEVDIERLGRKLAGAVIYALESTEPVDCASIRVTKKDIDFRYRRVPSSAEYEQLIEIHTREYERWRASDEETKRNADWEDAHINRTLMHRSMINWATRMRDLAKRGEIPESTPGELQIFRLGTEIALVGVPGELFTDIGLTVKRNSPVPFTMICGYANGTLGYIPSKAAVQEGGYEVNDAYKLYGFPECFHEDTEPMLYREIDAALRD